MSEYISRQEVLETIRYRVCQGQGNKEHMCKLGSCAYCGIMEIMSDISSIEAADVQPAKHGRWERRTSRIYACTECTNEVTDRQRKNYSFCPYCGSKQDLGGD